MAALFVSESSDLTLTGLAKALHREIAPLARAAQRLAEKAKKDARMMSLIENTRSTLRESQKVKPDPRGCLTPGVARRCQAGAAGQKEEGGPMPFSPLDLPEQSRFPRQDLRK